MTYPTFEIFKGKDDKFYFRLYAANAQQILASQGYASKQGCQTGIESVKANAPDRERYVVHNSKDGKFYFTLLAANQQVIGTSQIYASKQNCEKGIDSVGRTAPDAPVMDAT